MPKENERGKRESFRGDIVLREQIVRPVSSLYVAFGSLAANYGLLVRKMGPQPGVRGRILLFLSAATIAINVASKAFPS